MLTSIQQQRNPTTTHVELYKLQHIAVAHSYVLNTESGSLIPFPPSFLLYSLIPFLSLQCMSPAVITSPTEYELERENVETSRLVHKHDFSNKINVSLTMFSVWPMFL